MDKKRFVQMLAPALLLIMLASGRAGATGVCGSIATYHFNSAANAVIDNQGACVIIDPSLHPDTFDERVIACVDKSRRNEDRMAEALLAAWQESRTCFLSVDGKVIDWLSCYAKGSEPPVCLP